MLHSRLSAFLYFLLLVTTTCTTLPPGSQTAPPVAATTPVSFDDGQGVIRKAVFDLGSGTYRMKIAKVSTTDGHVIEVIDLPKDALRLRADGAADFSRSPDGRFSAGYMEEAAKAYQSLVDLARRQGASEFVAIATGVFRRAKNAAELTAALSEKTGVPVRILTGEEESRVGYFGGALLSKVPAKNLLVWDIGGQTMQWSYVDTAGKLQFQSLEVGAVNFKNRVITDIQKKDAAKVPTPNPMSAQDGKRAVVIAQGQAAEVGRQMRDRLKVKGMEVVGIGGVHVFSIQQNISDKGFYTLADAKALLAKQIKAKYNDEQLTKVMNTKYPETDVSNIALVIGFMQALKLDKIRVVAVDNTDGLLLAPRDIISAKK